VEGTSIRYSRFRYSDSSPYLDIYSQHLLEEVPCHPVTRENIILFYFQAWDCLSTNMGENQKVQRRDDSPQLDLCQDLQSIDLTGLANDLPSDTGDAIATTLKYVDKKAMVEDFFLQRLAFTAMDNREEEITAAHRATFDWIFNSHDIPTASRGTVISWLRESQEHKVYWISGKPGSGKSTLMRYLNEHRKTNEALKVWARKKPLICPRFFFWTSGTTDQKSASGFMRSLLHQLLQATREMIPWTFPEMWLKYQDTTTRVREPIEWSVELLRVSLQRLLKLYAGRVKICFFIDGLDELEGDQVALVSLLHSMVHSSPEDFKACVSSRPWKVFEDAFVNIPKLKLQDLTRKDIWQFVGDSLDSASMVRRILKMDEEAAEDLKIQITDNSDGVFLWATLAVKSLVERAVSTDTIADLVRKLDVLPTDLDALFRHLLLESKTDAELEEQSRILQIIHAREVVCDFTKNDSSNVVTLYQMALATGSLEDREEPTKLLDAQILYLSKSVKERVLDRCAGLLRVHQSRRKGGADREGSRVKFGGDDADLESLARGRINYLHRTVRDFFAYSGDFGGIASRTEPGAFDPHICLLRSHVLQLRFPLETPEKHRRLDEWWPDVILALTHARHTSQLFIGTQVELLNRFKSTLDWYWMPKRLDPLDNWARNAFATYEQRMKYRTPYHYPFLSLATKFGLRHYVEAELDTGNYPYIGGVPLLSYAVQFIASRRSSVYPLSSPDMIQMLLKKGQDPNLSYKNLANKDETPWLLTLKYIREAERRQWIEQNESAEGIQRWTRIAGLIIEHGGDPNALILKDMWDPAASALDVLTMVNKKNPTPSITGLFDLLGQRGATLHATGE
jgi:hypothetical protein